MSNSLAEFEEPVETVSPLPSPRVHLDYLDGLRALAALYVVMHHCALEIWPVGTYGHPPAGIQMRVLSVFLFGHFAVSVFIVLSGFCLMLPVVKEHWTVRGGAVRFFQKRARRILPPYYLAMALSLGLIFTLVGHKTGTHWDNSIPVTLHGFISHILLVQDVISPAQINHVFWSIAVEWQIYFCFPLLVLLWRRLGGQWTTIGAVLISMIAVDVLKHSPLIGITPQYGGLFAIGMLGAALAYSMDSRWTSWRERLPWPLLALGFGAIAGLLIHGHKDWEADYFVGVASISLMVMVARSATSRARAFLSSRPLVAVGGFSYSLYLVHAPLIQVIWQYILHPLNMGKLATFGLLIGLGCPLIVGAAYVFYLGCERPFITRRQPPVHKALPDC